MLHPSLKPETSCVNPSFPSGTLPTALLSLRPVAVFQTLITLFVFDGYEGRL